MPGRQAKVLRSANFYFLQCSDVIKEQQVDSQTNVKILIETLNQSKMMKRKQQANFLLNLKPQSPKQVDSLFVFFLCSCSHSKCESVKIIPVL